MSTRGTHSCGCGKDFETLAELKAHVKKHHPDVYEERFAS
jgi:hypothetical protein